MKKTSYSCSKCRDTSWLLIDGKARRCSCYEINLLKKIMGEVRNKLRAERYDI